jgi:hypothetical protein
VTIETALSDIAFDEPLDDKMFDPPAAVGAAPAPPPQ